MGSVGIVGLDLFAGAGGLSLGATAAGVHVAHAVEVNPSAAETYRQNHRGTAVIVNNIALIESLPIKPRIPLILFGGPPCQGFSTSNQRTRKIQDPRNWLFEHIFRFVRSSRPKWIVIENVAGLATTEGGLFARLIGHTFEKHGYKHTVWTLNAKDFGIPQNRERLFFIGCASGELPPPPRPEFTKSPTVGDALKDLPKLPIGASLDVQPYGKAKPSKYGRRLRRDLVKCSGHLVTANNETVVLRYRHIPQGGNWRDIPRSLMANYTNLTGPRSLHTGLYRRLVWHHPSPVIANFRKTMLIHPIEDRGLSVREAARIQSFPDWFEFKGSIGQQQQQVGNAVPPALAAAVFRQIVDWS